MKKAFWKRNYFNFKQIWFCHFTQRGSHIKLKRIGSAGDKQTLTIPSHDELDVGTLRAIVRQASRYIPEEQLKPYFYSK
ncbi:type II toxin-antitoxin system HicA family toxin [Candidatus Brocadia sinica]|uniref:type II toxin-antitoxin system HicA family toxin n=1 Tax=Candidatus Brocadia sp. AMX2 TaxID=2293635 RepID=UPI001910FF5A